MSKLCFKTFGIIYKDNLFQLALNYPLVSAKIQLILTRFLSQSLALHHYHQFSNEGGLSLASGKKIGLLIS